MTTIRHEAVVPLSAAGRRFDQTLAEMFPDYSRSRLSGWIKAGAVTLDGATAPPRQLLQGRRAGAAGGRAGGRGHQRAAEDIALDIVHEDDASAGAEQAGRPGGASGRRQPGRHRCSTRCCITTPALAELPRGGIVHRLDKDTSGLMVVARTLAGAHRAGRHAVAPRGGAPVRGGGAGHAWSPAARSMRRSAASMGDRLRQAVRDEEDGKRAVTHYRLRERFRAHSAGAVPAGNRAHPPDPRAHGAYPPSAGRRPALRRRPAAAQGRHRRNWWPRCVASGARRCMPSSWRSSIRSPARRWRSVPRDRPISGADRGAACGPCCGQRFY